MVMMKIEMVHEDDDGNDDWYVDKHCGVGVGALTGSTPLPRGFNVRGERERERKRDDERVWEIERELFIIHSFPIKG